MSLPTCPLTGTTEVQTVATFPSSELIRLFQWKRGVDVAEEIPEGEIHLCSNPDIGFYFFHPLCAGSEEFYNQMTSAPRYITEKQEYHFAAKLVSSGAEVLDVGCGWGFWASYVEHARYRGLELSRSAVKVCQDKGLKVESRLVEEMADSDPEFFDVVASFQVLEHVADPTTFFADCLRCLKKGGRLIISVPNADSFMSTRENNYLNYPPHHVTWWTLQTLEYLAKKFSLEILEYHVDRALGNELAMHNAAQIQNRFNRIVNRPTNPIRNSLVDRFLLRGFDATGKIISKFKTLDPKPAHGQSLTVVFRKP